MITTSAPIQNQTAPAENPSSSHSPLSSDHFFPPGEFTLILGHPGTGKSFLSLDLAARFSRRSPLPPHPFTHHLDPTPACPNPIPPLSIIASREDNSHIIQLRLRAAGGGGGAGADVACTRILDHTSLLPDPHAGEDADSLLYHHVVSFLDKNPRLVILDPFPAFLENHDSTHATAVRNIVEPFLHFALECGITVLGIAHLNKSSRSEHPLHRAAGSNAYTALARSVLLVTHDDLTFRKNRRLVIPLKNNLAPITHGLAFTLCTSSIKDPTFPSPAYLQWDQTPITHHPLLIPPTASGPTDTVEKSQFALALDFLQTALAPGPLPSKTLLKGAHAIGLSTSTLNRARSHLNIKVTHHGPTNQWIMQLPGDTMVSPTSKSGPS